MRELGHGVVSSERLIRGDATNLKVVMLVSALELAHNRVHLAHFHLTLEQFVQSVVVVLDLSVEVGRDLPQGWRFVSLNVVSPFDILVVKS